jgi:hypothetical protein
MDYEYKLTPKPESGNLGFALKTMEVAGGKTFPKHSQKYQL